MKTDPSLWVKPEDLLAWQLVEYSKKYKANFASYKLHYRAAVRPKPNSISIQRMEWLVERGVIMRMKGEIPNGERDIRRVKGSRNTFIQTN